MTDDDTARTAPPPVIPLSANSAVPQFDSRQLFGDATEICIRHDQSVYRLKITRQGKLILNK